MRAQRTVVAFVPTEDAAIARGVSGYSVAGQSVTVQWRFGSAGLVCGPEARCGCAQFVAEGTCGHIGPALEAWRGHEASAVLEPDM